MAEWRLGRGWSEPELDRRLAAAARWQRSFDPDAELTPARGWNANRSEAVIAQEPAGPPLPDGPFVRARSLVESYAFSDPRIVKGHFDPAGPLLGRRMLLEAQALGLHYLGAVVVGDVLALDAPGRTVRGFRYDTLDGHFESGYEWFLIAKDHRSGEVRFRIEAAWQEGAFPNAWSRLGFRLIGRHYQRAWHRLAYQRLRVMLGSAGLDPLPRGRRLVHGGPSLRVGYVHALGVRRRPPDLDSELETVAEPSAATDQGGPSDSANRELRMEVPMGVSSYRPERKAHGSMVTAAGLGAIAGTRTMLAPALLRLMRPDLLARAPGSEAMLRVPAVANGLPLLAAGEMIADKTPWIPPRTELLPLAGRLFVGAWAGATIARNHQPQLAAAAGALAAFGAAHLAYRIRRFATSRFGISNIAAGLSEDVLVTAAGLLLLRRTPRDGTRLG